MNQPAQWDIVSSVGLTALGAAASRAIESSRPDRLVDDPFVAAFVEAARPPIPMTVRWPADGDAVSETDAVLVRSSAYVGVRSRFFDDFLSAACAAGVRQVVVLAAGLDTRAFRLDWPDGVRLFEVDQPKVLEFKDAVLRDAGARARCERQAVATDLRGDWREPLRAAGFDPGSPTAWLAEGLLPYLPPDAETKLFGHVDTLSATGSRLAVEHSFFDPGGVDAIRDATGFDLAELVHTDARPRPADWLAGQGWLVTDEPAVSTARRYGRDLADPRLDRLPGTPLRIAENAAFLSAQRPDRAAARGSEAEAPPRGS
jgi:methyltransferase (TIGR00027 family)